MTKNWPPEIQQQIAEYQLSLSSAFMSAFIDRYGICKGIQQDINPTDFDYEWRYWLKEANEDDIKQDPELAGIQQNLEVIKASKPFKEAVACYYRLTNIPPKESMLVVTIDKNRVDMVFAPRVEQPKKNKKSKGFG